MIEINWLLALNKFTDGVLFGSGLYLAFSVWVWIVKK